MKPLIKTNIFQSGKEKLKHLTLLDGLIIFAVLSAIVLFGYFFFRQNIYLTVRVKVGESNVLWPESSRAWFSQLFYQGMKERDGFGRITAEVTQVRSFDREVNRKDIYLTIRVKTTYNRTSGQYIYRGKPVLIGSTIKLFLDAMLMDGLVVNIEGVKDPRERKTLIVESQLREETPVYAETSGVRTYVADAINQGDEFKDSNNEVIVKVLQKRTEDALKVVTTNDGRVLIGSNPLRKDAFLTLEIHAIKINDRYYVYDDVPILIGIPLPINTPTLSVWPEVTKILSIK